ncbi:glycosyltransferase family 4 protein [Arthrobacter subterraneus]
MFAGTHEPRALHLYDCADVGATLVQYGRAAGRPWRILPARDTHGDGSDLMGGARRALGIADWTARRWLRSVESDLLHVHFGTRLDVVARRPRKPFVVHYHGTDIRTFYYDPSQRDKIQWGADNAAAVVYSTPDLKPHAEAARSDAVYLPNPVNLAELPSWDPSTVPVVVFASRWEGSKGGEQQLELLEEIRRAVGPQVRLQGLDWGDGAAAARERGAELVPRMPKPDYLRWLASAHCVVGQMSGSLGMSELQALGIGVPLLANLKEGYYPGPLPVVTGEGKESLAAGVLRILDDPLAAAGRLQPREWVETHHHPDVIVERLAGIYSGLAQAG